MCETGTSQSVSQLHIRSVDDDDDDDNNNNNNNNNYYYYYYYYGVGCCFFCLITRTNFRVSFSFLIASCLL